MSRIPEGLDKHNLYIAAREVLLDGLEALAEQASALTLVGAQAVYLRTNDPSVDLTIPVYTSDSDISIDPSHLSDDPKVDEVLKAAGFALMRKGDRTLPGQWFTSRPVGDKICDIPMDLLVPRNVSGTTSPRRWSVNLPPHERLFARTVDGLEAALVDSDPMEVASLQEPSVAVSKRVVNVRVAGPAALFVAKAHKIAEREIDAGRGRHDRLMLGTEPEEVATRFDALLLDERTASVTHKGLTQLHNLFGGTYTTGTQMAVRALAGDPIESEIPGIVSAYLADLPHLDSLAR